jgi:uncharacterized protein (TIGR01244 family)
MLAAFAMTGPAVLAQEVVRENVPGIQNFARLETVVACTGALDPEVAMPGIKRMGFASVINLREVGEPGAVDPEEERRAAEAAGLRYFHVPFNGSAPEPKAADAFLAAIRTPGAEPALIHCAAGNRAAGMWLIKRLVVDRWETGRAIQEANDLGLRSEPLRQFAIEYARTRGQ